MTELHSCRENRPEERESGSESGWRACRRSPQDSARTQDNTRHFAGSRNKKPQQVGVRNLVVQDEFERLALRMLAIGVAAE